MPIAAKARNGRSPTGSYVPAIGILGIASANTGDKRLFLSLKATHRRLRSHSWQLLRAAEVAREAARVARWYRTHRGGPMARPPGPPVAAFGEVETMFRCGFRSIRAWRRARRYGGFPEPTRVTTEGPIWTERQIAAWLGEDHLGMDQLEGATTHEEAALLAEIEHLELTA